MRGATGESKASSSAAAAVYASLAFAVRARSVLSMRRNNQVVSMENAHEQELRDLYLFQVHVADRLRSLASASDDDKGDAEADDPSPHHQQPSQQLRHPLISLRFLRKLLDAFVCIEEEFKALLLVLLGSDPALVSRPPLDRLVPELLDRAVKSLDVCNAVTHALNSLRFSQKHAEVVASALHPPSAAAAPFVGIGEAQFHRARRASSKLLECLAPDSYYKHHVATTGRARSFGRSSGGSGAREGGSGSGSGSGSSAAVGSYGRRCVALNVSQNLSAAKQMQAMLANPAPPRGADATALATAVYTMHTVMVFVMWTLVGAFPCQERGGHAVAMAATSFPAPPRQLPWAAPIMALQEGIAEEWRRRDGKDSSGGTPSPGLLVELQSMVRCGRALVDLGGGDPVFPLDERQREELADVWSELAATCRIMEEELGPLQRRVREVFHRVVLSRAEVLRCISRGDRTSSSAAITM